MPTPQKNNNNKKPTYITTDTRCVKSNLMCHDDMLKAQQATANDYNNYTKQQ